MDTKMLTYGKTGRNILYVILVVFTVGGGFLNAQSISPSVIASAGGYGSDGNYSISWTLGELAVTTLSGGDWILTQGFQQPWEVDINNSVDDPEYDWGVLGYPNPVRDRLRLHFNLETAMDLEVEITDMTGKKLGLKKYPGVLPGQEVEIDFSGFAQGMYLITVRNLNRTLVRTLRVQKY